LLILDLLDARAALRRQPPLRVAAPAPAGGFLWQDSMEGFHGFLEINAKNEAIYQAS
jgi:hypothetical protein